jgi:hypothetical protein
MLSFISRSGPVGAGEVDEGDEAVDQMVGVVPAVGAQTGGEGSTLEGVAFVADALDGVGDLDGWVGLAVGRIWVGGGRLQ